MKKKLIGIFFCMLLIPAFVFQVSACTGFMINEDESILVGHNKDWWTTDVYLNVYPPSEGKHGRLFFEIPYPITIDSSYYVLAGGINDQGLFYESFVTPKLQASFELFKPPLFKHPAPYLMETYSTVAEVVEYIESHNLYFMNLLLSTGQIFVVDKNGDSAIIEGDDIIYREGDYQVCTNFLHSHPELGGYPCWRYKTVVNMLENMTDPSVEYCREILNASHQDGYTQYSNIFDLNNGILYLHHFHDYKNYIEINLTKEFNLGVHSYYLPSLFEPINNQPPEKPDNPIGPISGRIKTEYVYETNTIDPDNDYNQIYYKWDFGDGTQSYWILNKEPYFGKILHTWKKTGNYDVRVKARDIYGCESEWSDPLTVAMPKNKAINPLILFLERLSERFPVMEQILHQIYDKLA